MASNELFYRVKYGVALAKVNDDGSLSYPEIPKENGNALFVAGSISPIFLALILAPRFLTS